MNAEQKTQGTVLYLQAVQVKIMLNFLKTEAFQYILASTARRMSEK